MAAGDQLERQRDLVPRLTIIERRSGLGAEEFLERYYAVNRPVILKDEMADWPALTRWTPEYLKAAVGTRPVEFQGERTANQRFEMNKDAHRREAPFDAFIDQILRPGAGNDAYLTAYNSARNAEALSVLQDDLGFLDKFLDRNVAGPHGMIWIGPAGTVTSLHHDLTNNLIAQIVGRKRVKLAPAAEVGKLYNDHARVQRDFRSGSDRHSIWCGTRAWRGYASTMCCLSRGNSLHASWLVASGQVARFQRDHQLHQLPVAEQLPRQLSSGIVGRNRHANVTRRRAPDRDASF